MALIVYGVYCQWWDSIDKTARTPVHNGVQIPCCPFCGSVLYQMEESDWWRAVDTYEAKSLAGYRKYIEWRRGKCLPSVAAADAAYAKQVPGWPNSEA